MNMNVSRSRQAFPPESSVETWWQFRVVSLPNLIRALAAILFWSLLIGVVSLCYELWRLGHNWRLGMG
jgi:hypothetical protein